MKRFILSVLCVSVFFLGVGALIDKADARFKSDEKALELVRKARTAMGGDSALAAVQSMRIVGQTTHNVKMNGVERQQQGQTEINMMMPDKFMKFVTIGHTEGTSDNVGERNIEVIVTDKDQAGRKLIVEEASPANPGNEIRKIVIKRPDGTTEELSGAEANKVIIRDLGAGTAVWNSENVQTDLGDKQYFFSKADDAGAGRHNEILRLSQVLLMTAPQGSDVSYTFGGVSSVDGTLCNIVIVEAAGSSFKIYLDNSSNMPVMMTYTGDRMPRIAINQLPATASSGKTGVFERQMAETAEFTVKFSDYRSVNGVQLPHRWTQTVGGVTDETFDVTSYEINPANIADKFKNKKVMIMTTKPDMQ